MRTAAPEGISSTPLHRHDGGAPAVVFLHGIGGAARAWAPQIAAFKAAGLHPVALDLPGYGARPAVDTMDFEALAADLEATIERLGLERPALVGHSMGGMIAQTAMRRRPDGYCAAVLVGTSPAFGDSRGEFQKKFIADRLGPLEAGATMPELAVSIVDGIMGPNPDASGRALAIDTMAATPASTYRAAVKCIVTFDERANLPNIERARPLSRGRARPQCTAPHDGADGRKDSRRALRVPARRRPPAERRDAGRLQRGRSGAPP